MSFWPWSTNKEVKEFRLETPFGRFSDAYKKPSQYEAWDRAMELCEDGLINEIWPHLQEFLLNGAGDNILMHSEGGETKLTIFQGSTRIIFVQNSEGCRAEVSMVNGEGVDLALMRRLLESNYQFKYCRYALTSKDEVKLIFDSHIEDISPYKLYYALKEMALHGDRHDDRLAAEWENVELMDLKHVQLVESEDLEGRLKLTRTLISEFYGHLTNPDLGWEEHQHGLTYMILDLVYRIDYLTRPQGVILRKIEQIHGIYFHEDQQQRHDQNRASLEIIESIREMSEDSFEAEYYDAPYTFGVMETCGAREILALIHAERKNLDWYLQEGYTVISKGFIGFIIGYALYVYAPPLPIRRLLGLFYESSTRDWNILSGKKTGNHDSNQEIDTKVMQIRLSAIKNEARSIYPEIEIEALRDGMSQIDFGMWILDQIGRLNLSKA